MLVAHSCDDLEHRREPTSGTDVDAAAHCRRMASLSTCFDDAGYSPRIVSDGRLSAKCKALCRAHKPSLLSLTGAANNPKAQVAIIATWAFGGQSTFSACLSQAPV